MHSSYPRASCSVQDQEHQPGTRMVVSINWGPFLRSSCNKSPAIFGCLLGAPEFANSQIEFPKIGVVLWGPFIGDPIISGPS